MNLTVDVEKSSNVVRKLTVKVPAATVAEHFERGLAEVQKTANVKGFRQGHVPITVIKQMYGDDVRHKVFHNLIEESYRQAVRQSNLMPVVNPKIETPDHKTGEGAHDHSLKEDQDLNYTATVEIMPEIQVKSYKGIALKKDSVAITDQDVELIIKNLRDSQAELIPVAGGLILADGQQSSRAVKTGDYVDMEFEGGVVTETGINKLEGMKGSRMIEVGGNTLIPGFESNIEGMKRGETKTFRIKFPEDYGDAQLSGKDAEFTVKVNELKEKKLPELNDEFVKTMGYENLTDLMTKARDHLTKERAQEVERKLKSDLLQALIDKNPFEVPMVLVQTQTRALAQDIAENLKNQGYTEQLIQEMLGSEFENLKKRAETQVRSSLLLEAISKKENIELEQGAVDSEIDKIAASMKVEVDRLKDYYNKNPKFLEDLEYKLREEQTVKFLLGQSKVSEK